MEKEEEYHESWIEFLWISITVRFWKIWDFIRTLFLYYLPYPYFFFVDCVLVSRSFLKSPYRVLREYSEENPDKKVFGPYGETPFRVLDTLINRFSIPQNWTWIDLGCGRGRLLAWLSFVRKQRNVIGVEAVPQWYEDVQALTHWFQSRPFHIVQSDILTYIQNMDPRVGRDCIVYLYLSSMPDSQCRDMGKVFERIPGLHIMSVSYSFEEYGFSKIQVVDTCCVSFPWGKAEVYYQKVAQ